MDSDLPYLSAQRKIIKELYYIIDLAPYSLKSTVVNIENQFNKSGIFKASIYKELDVFNEYIDLERTYVVNRTSIKGYALSNILLNLKLLFFILKLKADIFQITSWFDYSKFLLYFFRKKTSLVVHDPIPHVGETFSDNFYRYIALRLYKNMIILNSNQKDAFVHKYKLYNKNILTSKLGVFSYMNIFITQTKPDIYYEPYILFFGRITRYKGVEYLLEAMKIVHEQYPTIKLVIAGKGDIYFNKSEFEKLPFIDFQYRFIPIDELAHLIKNSLFTICPYIEATQSGVISSSFGLCKPVIASNVGGLGEMISDGDTGILVEPRDILQLSKAICVLLGNKEKLVKMEQNIESRYFHGLESWEFLASEILAFYQYIIQKNN